MIGLQGREVGAAAAVASPGHGLRAWPRYRPGSVEIGGGGPRLLLSMGAGMAMFAAVFSIPLVQRATGLRAAHAALILGAYYAAMVVNDYVLHPAALRSRAGFNTQLAVLFFYNELFNLLLVVVPNRPWSPLWMSLALWAFKTGAWQEIDASLFALACHGIGPLLTIPVFLWRGAPLAESIAAPVLTSLVCASAYAMLSAMSASWRAVRQAQREEIDRYRERAATLERERVARDLHDSLGSTLALTTSYARVMRRHAEDPDAIRRIADVVEEMGREGLDALRGLLDALSPDDTTVDAVVRTAERLAERCEAAHQVRVDLEALGDRTRPLSGDLHVAVARVIQEALRNAIRHGGAGHVGLTIDARAEAFALRIEDDGAGVVASESTREGRGLSNMRHRATERGGRFAITPRAGGGTVVTWEVPWRG